MLDLAAAAVFLLAIGHMIEFARAPRPAPAGLSAIAAGISTGIKYSGPPFLLALLAAFGLIRGLEAAQTGEVENTGLLRHRGRRDRRTRRLLVCEEPDPGRKSALSATGLSRRMGNLRRLGNRLFQPALGSLRSSRNHRLSTGGARSLWVFLRARTHRGGGPIRPVSVGPEKRQTGLSKRHIPATVAAPGYRIGHNTRQPDLVFRDTLLGYDLRRQRADHIAESRGRHPPQPERIYPVRRPAGSGTQHEPALLALHLVCSTGGTGANPALQPGRHPPSDIG